MRPLGAQLHGGGDDAPVSGGPFGQRHVAALEDARRSGQEGRHRQHGSAVRRVTRTRGIESLMSLYESEAAFATEPGSLAHGLPGVREALNGFISMNGKLDLEVTRVLKVVVFVNSTSGLSASADWSAYAASKFAEEGRLGWKLTWDFAAGPELNGAVLELLSPHVRRRVLANSDVMLEWEIQRVGVEE